MQQNDEQNAGQNNQGLGNIPPVNPALEKIQQDNQSRGFHDNAESVGAKQPMGMGGANFQRAHAVRPQPMVPTYPQPGAMGSGQMFGLGRGFGGSTYTPIHQEEFDWEISAIEETFANYMTEFPPIYVQNEERDANMQKAIRYSVVMVRNLREFVVAQLAEHVGSRIFGHDPFFAQNRIPRLLPIPAHEAEGKPWEAIPFVQYYQRLGHCFPNFKPPVFLHQIMAFGELLCVATSTVKGAAHEHYLILPDAKKVVDYTLEKINQQPHVPGRCGPSY